MKAKIQMAVIVGPDGAPRLAFNQTRVAGQKMYGIGKITHEWTVDAESFRKDVADALRIATSDLDAKKHSEPTHG